MEAKFHIPVMFDTVLDLLNLKPGATAVDATVGTAGHSIGIAERVFPGGRLIAIDRDKESLEVARSRLSKYSGGCEFVHGNFSDIDGILAGLKIKSTDAILFDLGISSFQLSDPQRGFTFRQEGPLDMRMDRTSYISAYDLVNNLNEDEISSMLWSFGQERWHNRIAHLVVEKRQRQPIATTAELAGIVSDAIPSRFRHRHFRIHPATRTFQAVRIAVNRELEALEKGMSKAVELLAKKGRICVISFHSLEDRIVKWTFKGLAAEGRVKIITPKPLTPDMAQVEENPLCRSAKLRCAERV